MIPQFTGQHLYKHPAYTWIDNRLVAAEAVEFRSMYGPH